MSGETSPVKDISVDTFQLRDGKYLPALAKESKTYWRSSAKKLARDRSRENSG